MYAHENRARRTVLVGDILFPMTLVGGNRVGGTITLLSEYFLRCVDNRTIHSCGTAVARGGLEEGAGGRDRR